MLDMSWFHEYPYTNFHEFNLDHWVLKLREVVEEVNRLEEWKITHEAEYEQLKTLYDQVMSGNFPPAMQQAFYEWMQKNAVDIVGSMVKMVFFGLTDDGYFVVHIPDSWSDITFGTTGLDTFPAGYDYGHLTLSY